MQDESLVGIKSYLKISKLMKIVCYILCIFIVYSCNKNDDDELNSFLDDLKKIYQKDSYGITVQFEDGKLTELEWYGKIKEIPSSFYFLNNLTYLEFYNYGLDTLPNLSGIDDLHSLVVLGEFKNVNFDHLPRGLRFLELVSPFLKDTLIISNNVSNLTNLKIYYSNIEFIKFTNPKSFNTLHELQLGGNRIQNIDESLYQLPELSILNVFGNSTKDVQLSRFPRLRYVGIEDSLISEEDLLLINSRKILKDTMYWYDGRKLY